MSLLVLDVLATWVDQWLPKGNHCLVIGVMVPCCKVGCLVFFPIFFLFFLIHPDPFYPLLLVCHTCITIGATFHLLRYSISFYPCSTPILLHISRYKLVTTNLSSFSLTAHDEPIWVSEQLSSLVSCSVPCCQTSWPPPAPMRILSRNCLSQWCHHPLLIISHKVHSYRLPQLVWYWQAVQKPLWFLHISFVGLRKPLCWWPIDRDAMTNPPPTSSGSEAGAFHQVKILEDCPAWVQCSRTHASRLRGSIAGTFCGDVCFSHCGMHAVSSDSL